MDDIKDVKPPLALPPDLWWLWIVLGVCAVGLIVFLILRRKKHAPPAPEVILPPWDIAYQQLEQLRQKDLLAQGLFKEFLSAVSDILRHYIEARFNIRAPEMTTEEFLQYLNKTIALTAPQKQALKEFLYACDLVKFAKHQTTIDEAKNHFDLAKKFIDETCHGI